MTTRLLLGLMWLLHFLPLRVLGWIGNGLGLVLYAVIPERRHVTRVNLGLCFPELTPAQKSALARRHLMAFGRSVLEMAVWWHASPERIRRLVKIEGEEKLDALAGQPVIILVPHFVGIDAGAIRVLLRHKLVAIYTRQKNRVFESAMNGGRERFGTLVLASRQEGTKKALKAVKAGHFFHYSPDMDYGPRESVFVPFFGVPTATITGLARLARVARATVIPMVTTMEPAGYVARVGEPWIDFPSGDDLADAARMNAYIESEVRKQPAQYYWLHKRFKTRPAGEKRVY